jgi:GH24 family phage-related lysozyme (muramidase)
MNRNQKAAIVSFAYNLGAYFYGSQGFNTITKELSNKDNWKNVPKALLLYVNPGSAFEAGLRARRKAEGDLWIKIPST